MRNTLSLCALLILLPGFPRQLPAAQSAWQQSVRYRIEATLDTTAQQLQGHLTLFYKNNSPDTLAQLYLLVPANAFHDAENTAMREMRRFSSKNIRIIRTPEPKVTIRALQFLSIGTRESFPLQAFDFSDTILQLPLPYPLVPGDSLSIGISFIQDFASADSSGKHRRQTYEFVNWFPRMAVYDSAGWHAEPFHFMMEETDVFSEFATFDVAVTVPGNYVTVAAGELVAGDPAWDRVSPDTSLQKEAFTAWHDSVKNVLRLQAEKEGPHELRFRAANMHNFVWSTSPNFVHYGFDTNPPLHLFLRGKSRWFGKSPLEVKNQVDSVRTFMQAYYGPHALPQLNIVQSHSEAVQPGLFMLASAEDFSLAAAFSVLRVPATVSIDGVKESWIPKGLAIYFGKAYSEFKYGKLGYDAADANKDRDWLERQYPLPALDELLRNFTRLYINSGQNEPIANSIHNYKDPLGTAFNLYLKSELFFEMLQYVVGDSVFKHILREFARRFRFTHASEADLYAVCEAVSGQDLRWFFDQWLRGTATVDYKSGKIKQYRGPDSTWVTEVPIQRKGDGVMPVEVVAEMPDGSRATKRWDGHGKSAVVKFSTPEKPRRVIVDPNDRIMDMNPANNRKLRLEYRPDLPLMRLINIPADAYVVLWKPSLGYNDVDGLRIGIKNRGAYQAFFNNLDFNLFFGFKSQALDGEIGYSHPLRRSNMLNRYRIFAKKLEGRYDIDARLSFAGSRGIMTATGRSLELGLNYSGLLNSEYTFLKFANDTGSVEIQEWEDKSILLAYAEGKAQVSSAGKEFSGRLRAEAGLPGGDAQFVKLMARLQGSFKLPVLQFLIRLNGGTAFGPDPLPAQDKFRVEGANPRQRYQHGVLKSKEEFISFRHRLVDGGGFMRGYVGQPLPAEQFASANMEFGPSGNVLGIRLFGFFDTGRVWQERQGSAKTVSDAGIALSLFGGGVPLFGGNVALLQNLAFRLYFPIWLSDPPPGSKKTKFRWYFTLGKSL